MCNALLPALEASNRIPSEGGGETTFKLLLAEDSLSIPLSPCVEADGLFIDVVNQKVAMKFLSGHQTDIVENGALAVEAVKRNFYDVRPTLLLYRQHADALL